MSRPRPTPAAVVKCVLLLLGMMASLGYLAASGTGETKQGERVVETRFIRGLPPLPWYEWVERVTPDGPEVTVTFRWYTFTPPLVLVLACWGVLMWRGFRPGNWDVRDGPGRT